MALRVGMLTQAVQGQCQVVARAVQAGRQLQRPLVRGDGLARPVEVAQRVGEVQVELRSVGREFEAVAQPAQALDGIARVPEGKAHQVRRRCVSGVGLEHGSAGAGGADRVAGGQEAAGLIEGGVVHGGGGCRLVPGTLAARRC